MNNVIHLPKMHKLLCKLRQERVFAEEVLADPDKHDPATVARCRMFLAQRQLEEVL